CFCCPGRWTSSSLCPEKPTTQPTKSQTLAGAWTDRLLSFHLSSYFHNHRSRKEVPLDRLAALSGPALPCCTSSPRAASDFPTACSGSGQQQGPVLAERSARRGRSTGSRRTVQRGHAGFPCGCPGRV